jgi:4-amino-4-deoxy-L-arabinose transferase-like glycosyltransferase
MPVSELASALLLLVGAAAIDVALFRWRRQAWRPDQASGPVERLVVWVDGLYDTGLQWFGRRLPRLDCVRPRFAALVNLNRADTTTAAAMKADEPAPAGPAAPAETAGELAEAAGDLAADTPAVVSTTPSGAPSGEAPYSPSVPEFVPAASAPSPSIEQPPTPMTALPATYLVQIASNVINGPNDGLARVSINVEIPVGATIRLTIETGQAGQPAITPASIQTQPAITQASIRLQPALIAPAPALVAAPATANLDAPSPMARPAPRAAGPAVPRWPGQLHWPGQSAWVSQLGSALRAAWQRLLHLLSTRVKALPQVLFWSSVGIYLLTRLIGLDRYPIYFFTDEAVHTVLAADFVHSGLQNSDHELLPTYFPLGPTYNLNGVSVYLQVIPYLLFGNSETVTRATSALVTLIAAIAVGLILRDIFKRRYWWTATLLLSVTPAWFLHSRTAFEYIEVAAYYAGFLYCYLRYRYISPRSLYGVVLFGALAFYTHGLGEVLMGVATLLLAVSDWRYHWQQRAVVGRALGLAVLLALPYVRYDLAHPSTTLDQLRQRGSYWVQDGLSLGNKLSQFFSEYRIAFSPNYWFQADNGRDIERHVMKGYGNLWLPTLPLLALGLVYTIRHLRSSSSRTVLLALLAAPVGPALAAIGMPRDLWEIIPIVLLSAIGLCLALEWLEDHRVPATALALGTFVVLAGFNIYMLRDALVNGGLWATDYTLAGVQFGARQIFGEAIPSYLAQHPDAQIMVSSTWANGTDEFVPFFLNPQQASHVQLQSLDFFLTQRRDLPPNLEVVLPVYEYNRAMQNPKLADITVDKIIPYPNGQPGFYFMRFGYSAQADATFAAEEAKLLQPVTETIQIDGQAVAVTHPQFGAGQLHDMLDGSPYTLINAPGFNPVVLDFAFPAARPMNGLTLITGSLPDFTVTATVTADNSATPQVYSQTFVGLPPDPTVKIDFNRGPSSVVHLRLEINNDLGGGPAVNIHVRDVQFRTGP